MMGRQGWSELQSIERHRQLVEKVVDALVFIVVVSILGGIAWLA
jgi:hypothetical protein